MIKPIVSALFVCAVATVQSGAQNDLVLAANQAPVVEVIVPPAIVERGPHHARVQYVSAVQEADGSVLTITNQYVTLATGLNFKNKTDDWVSSRAEFQLHKDGVAVAQFAQHQAIVANDLLPADNSSVVDLLTPDGIRIQ